MSWPSLINPTLFCSIRYVTTEVEAVVVHATIVEKQPKGHGDVGFKDLSRNQKYGKF